MRRLATIAAALLVGAAVACDDGQERNVLYVSSSTLRSPGANVSATVEMPGLRVALTQAQLMDGGFRAPVVSSGTIRVRFVVTTTPADTIGRAEASLRITPGNNYSAYLVRQPVGQHNTCMGCSGHVTFPVTGSESASTDSWWVYYSNSPPLCKGCVI